MLFTEDTRKKLPSEYSELYDASLEFYTIEESESYREIWRAELIHRLYVDEYGREDNIKFDSCINI